MKVKTIGGQAAKKWCFLRLLPVISEDSVDPHDPAWRVMSALTELVEKACALKINTAQAVYPCIAAAEYPHTRKALPACDHSFKT